MLIKYGNLDVTSRLLDYKISSSFAEGYLIGNVPTIQLNLKFDNYDGIFDNLDTEVYWEIQETNASDKRYFKIYDQPEKYTKSLSLKLYDNNYSLDIAYDTKLTYPVQIKDQLDEIESLTGFSIIRTNIPDYVLNKEVAWYDNTIVIRSYLGWIAELCGANVFAKGINSLEFVKVTKDVFANTDTLTNYEKNEVYKVTRIYAENGLNSLEAGNETGNTMFLDANNLYLDEQLIVDSLYEQFDGLTFYSVKSVKMISIDNLLPGKLINYNDEFNFMVIDLSNTFKGGNFLLSDIDGTVTTKNEERVIKRINNTTRIRKLQITQDQESLKLDVIAKEQEGLNEKVGQLTITNEEINTKIEEINTKIEDIDTSLYRAFMISDATVLNEQNKSIVLSCQVVNGTTDITPDQTDIQFQWYKNEEKFKTGKSVTLTGNDIDVSANFKCIVSISGIELNTGSVTITDNNDIANLGNSFLDVTGSQLVQILNTDGTYSPNWEINNITITPAVLDGLLNVDLSNCDIVFKKIINSSETGLTNGENVSNGILNVSKNIMTKANPAVTYVCYVSYKNTSIKLFTSFSLNVLGKDGADGSDGKDGAVGPQGPTGDDGVSVISITPYFAVNASSTTPPDSGWITAQPVRANGQYLWRKDTTKFSNNTTSTTIPFVITGDKGEDAEPPVTEKTISNDTDNVFELTDSSNAYDAEITHIDGDYNQETTNGFQLSNASKLPTKSQGGATVTNNGDGSFTVSGSGNLSESYISSYYSSPENTRKLLKVGTLKAKVGGVVNPHIFINFTTNSGLISSKTLDDNYNFEITQEMLDNGLYFHVGFSGNKDQTIQAGTVKPMLYQDGDGTWEPYTGGVASPNPEYPQEPKFVGDYNEGTQKYDIDFVTSGKNLLNNEANTFSLKGVTFTINKDKSILLSGTATETIYWNNGKLSANLDNDKIYTLSGCPSGGGLNKYYMYLYNESFSLNDTGNGVTNMSKVTKKVVFGIAILSGVNVNGLVFKPQLEIGTTATDYQPYQGFETTTLQLNQPLRELPNDVKDTIENGVVTRRVGCVDLGDFDYTDYSNYNGYYTTVGNLKSDNYGEAICTHFKVIKSHGEMGIRIGAGNSNIYIEQVSSVYPTASEFKSAMSGVKLFYELATPTTEQITLPTLPAYSPYTMVWTNNDVKSRIDLHYYTMFKGDKGDDGTVHSATAPSDKTKLWFDTTDNLLKYWNGTTWEVTNDFAGDINDMKQNITTEYTSAINQLKESLTTLVEKLQTTTTDNSTLIEQLSSQIVQNSSSISLVTNSIKSITDNISGLATKEEISQWARFQDGVLELGASNSPFAVKLSNTELGFYQNGSRIAYLSNQQLNIEYAIVMTKLNIGTFSWNYDATDGLTLT